MPEKKPEPPMMAFKNPAEMEKWLAKNVEDDVGIWLRIYKKASGKPTVTYDEALQVALCYGWIDGLKRVYDSDSWIQKFTPRRKRSLWSKRNIEFTEKLIADKKMKPAGLAQIEAAKADGRWAQAYDKPSDMKVPDDFLKELKKHKQAYMFFQTLNKANTYAIAWRLQTAKKPETRAKRFALLLEMLKREEKLH